MSIIKGLTVKAWVESPAGSYMNNDPILCIQAGTCYTLQVVGDGEYDIGYKAIPLLPTGFKDKKGKYIYEGDVVKIDENAEQFKGTEFYDRELVSHHEIIWDDERGMYTDLRLEDGDCLAGYLDGDISFVCDGEVVGNIYENPEFKQWYK